jgi:hypothetical protein
MCLMGPSKFKNVINYPTFSNKKYQRNKNEACY